MKHSMTSFEAALDMVIDAASSQFNLSKKTTETLSLIESLGRITAVDYKAQYNLPRQNISAMDGYALCLESDQEPASEHQSFEIIGESLAGKPYEQDLEAGQCVLIATGATVPSNAQTVEMQENVEVGDKFIRLKQDTPSAKNIRFKGEEISQDDLLIPQGTVIDAQHIMLLAAQGYAELEVYQTLKLTVFTGGDELTPIGQPLPSEHAIYDCNGPALIALLNHLPAELINYQQLPDQPEAIKAALKKAAQTSDAIISSGGVSVGKHDFLRDCLEQLGEVSLYKIAMKPGKPFSFGKINNCLYFGLPGNPLSTFISFEQLVKPALLRLAGIGELPQSLELTAETLTPFKKRVGRLDFQRGFATQTKQGWQVAPEGQQDSHRVKSFSDANVLIKLAAESGNIDSGTEVSIIPFKDRFL